MKSFFTKVFLILLPLLFFTAVIVPHESFAQTHGYQQPVTVILAQNQVVNHDYFAAGNNVIVSGTVNGDAYIAGGNVDIEGKINGDLLVAGGQVNVRGDITQNVRAAGGNVHISGRVGRNVSVAGGTIDIARTASVSGSLDGVGGNFSLFGPVGKDVYLAGGNVELSNVIGGNANMRVGTLILSPQAKISQNLSYSSPEKARIATGALVQGKTYYTAAPVRERAQTSSLQNMWKLILGMYIALKLIGLVASLVIGLLLIRFMPNYMSRTADVLQKDFWRSLGVGFLTLILVPFVVILLFITLVGVPIALITIVSVIMIIYLAHIFAAVVIGRWFGQLLKKQYGKYSAFILGLVIYFILSFISPINLLLAFVVTFVGVGAVMIEELKFYKELRSKKLI